jgi:hypothetical protein
MGAVRLIRGERAEDPGIGRDRAAERVYARLRNGR